MKQESPKKNKLWVWLIAGFAALAVIVGVVLALVLPGQQAAPDTDGAVKLYWNVDRQLYVDPATSMSTREPAEDGLYHIRFALDGQQLELTANDKQLVNFIDFMDVVALTLDADGMIVDVIDPKTVATEVVKDAFIQNIDGNTIITNSSKAINGMETTIVLTENTGVYDVSGKAEVVGQVGKPALMDTVVVYANEAGQTTHVFIKDRAVEAGIYWRVDKMYDSSKAMTTREPDENGVYTIPFAHEGQQVELKCKDKDLVSEIDAGNAFYAEFAFVFDEEGYIVESVDVALALIGKKLCNNYNITEINGNTFTAVRQLEGNVGDSVTFTLGEGCDIFLVEDGCDAEFIGQRITELKMNDRLTCYTDLEGNPVLIFVVRRTMDYPMYYNVTRLYDSAAKQTKRTPNSQGWYELEMVGEGKARTLKTKDKALVDEIDSNTKKYMGLKLNGDIIEAVCDYRCVCGWSGIGEGMYVDTLSGTVMSIANPNNWNLSNYVLSPNCEIYDITGYPGVEYGSATQVRLGDRITGFQNASGEATHIFITQRYQDNAKIYYNTSRKYNGTTKQTNRKPDESGYYVFEMCCEGKEVTVKTKDKQIATFIDKENAPIVALEVKNGIIKNAYPALAAIKNGSKKVANFNYVDKIESDGTVTTRWTDNGKKGNTTFKMAKDCVVYNVSDYYINNRGEKTTLQVDDRIQGFSTNPDGEVVQIFVMKRQLNAPLYWKVDRYYNSETGETTRQPDADGYYVFDLAVNGQIKQYKTKDKTVANGVEKWSIAFTMRTKGNIILGVYSSMVSKGLSNTKPENFDVMSISGNKAVFQRNYPAATNYGDTLELTFAKNCKYYDVSSHAENFGAEAKLEVGDRVYGFTNEDGEIAYCYITNKHVREAGAVSLCQHCGKEVFWEPFTGVLHETDTHYYLTDDYRKNKQITFGTADGTSLNDAVIDLNGHTLTVAKRGFLVYGTLSIMDTAGGGKLVSENADNSFGGCVMVAGSGTLNVYSGTLTMAENAPKRSGGLIYAAINSKLNIYGGTFTGSDILVKGNNATVSGAPVIEQLTVDAAKKLNLGQLSQGAKIGISASGIFTQPNDKATQYAEFFAPVNEGDAIEVKDNALIYTANAVTPEPPVIPENVNDPLVFNAGTTDAYCPVCGKTVTWTAVTADGIGNAEGNAHYYLAEDITYTGTDNFVRGPGTNMSACLHLNGHDLTAQNSRVITGYAGVLNVMGSGTVSGNVETANHGAAVHINTNAVNGAVNLYGGTYTKPATNTTASAVAIWNNGGAINLYKGATIDGDLYIGTANLRNAQFGLFGGTVQNGTVILKGANPEKGYTSTFGMADGSISAMEVAGANTVTLTGAPVIGSLTLAEGVKLTLGELTEGAAITVSATGVFTEENANAEAYAQYFTPAEDGASVIAEGSVLKYIVPVQEEPEETDPVNANLVFDEGTTDAMCPVCNEKVTWTAVGATDRIKTAGHYYLEPGVKYGNGNTNFVDAQGISVCLHLNGNDMTIKGRIFVGNKDGVRGSVNIMGNGNVTSTVSTYGTLWCNGGDLNLYGGTYSTSVEGAANLTVGTTTAVVTLHKGATLGDTDSVNIAMNKAGTLNIDGAKIIGGDAQVIAGANVTLSGAPVIGKLVVAEGAKLTLGELTDGAAVTVTANGVFTEPNEKAADYAKFFTADGLNEISVADNALCIEDLSYLQNLSFDEGTTNAQCPICKKKVTWTALAGDAALTLNDGDHYYLAEDVTFAGADGSFLTAPVTGKTACVHLNGHNITATASRVATGGMGVLNIMGTGTVAGCYTGSGNNRGATLDTGSGSTVGQLNLYGGTYKKLAADVTHPIATTWNGGSINLYKGAQIVGTDSAKDSVKSYYGCFNMYGGTLSGDSRYQVMTSNYTTGKSGTFNMYSGELTGNVYITGVAAANSTFTMSGGTITGKVTIINNTDTTISGGTVSGQVVINASATNANSSVTLSGVPVIGQLSIPAGYKLTLGELTQGAAITVSASGVFAETDKAADYAAYFSPTADGDSVTAEDNTLVYTKA